MNRLTELERKIGYRFSERKLLERALRTVGRVNEMSPKELRYDLSQEALATLGDSVIRLLVIDRLTREGTEKKGSITRKTSELVSSTHLALIAEELALERFVEWGEGERIREEWHRSPRVLAECLEALVGAVYIDGGLESSELMLERIGLMEGIHQPLGILE